MIQFMIVTLFHLVMLSSAKIEIDMVELGVLLQIRESFNASLRPDLDDQCKELWVLKYLLNVQLFFLVCFIAVPKLLSLLLRLSVPQ